MTAASTSTDHDKVDSDEQSDNQPDWEAIARQEISISLDSEAEKTVADAAHGLGSAFGNGEDEIQSLTEYRMSALAFDERARELLYQTTPLDRDEAQEQVVRSAFAVAYAALSDNCDISHVQRYIDHLESEVEELSSADENSEC